MAPLRHTVCTSLYGNWLLTADDRKLLAVSPLTGPAPAEPETPLLTQARLWLTAFFQGAEILPPLPPLAPAGTPYQQLIWELTAAIPRGETRTYGAIAAAAARRTGHRPSPRAAGQALHVNPLPFFIPCHRVTAAGGGGGYAFGPELKRRLLALEKKFAG